MGGKLTACFQIFLLSQGTISFTLPNQMPLSLILDAMILVPTASPCSSSASSCLPPIVLRTCPPSLGHQPLSALFSRISSTTICALLFVAAGRTVRIHFKIVITSRHKPAKRMTPEATMTTMMVKFLSLLSHSFLCGLLPKSSQPVLPKGGTIFSILR